MDLLVSVEIVNQFSRSNIYGLTVFVFFQFQEISIQLNRCM